MENWVCWKERFIWKSIWTSLQLKCRCVEYPSLCEEESRLNSSIETNAMGLCAARRRETRWRNTNLHRSKTVEWSIPAHCIIHADNRRYIKPKLTNTKVFSTVDAKNAFWQLKLDDESDYHTTFETAFGRYSCAMEFHLLQKFVCPNSRSSFRSEQHTLHCRQHIDFWFWRYDRRSSTGSWPKSDRVAWTMSATHCDSMLMTAPDFLAMLIYF